MYVPHYRRVDKWRIDYRNCATPRRFHLHRMVIDQIDNNPTKRSNTSIQQFFVWLYLTCCRLVVPQYCVGDPYYPVRPRSLWIHILHIWARIVKTRHPLTSPPPTKWTCSWDPRKGQCWRICRPSWRVVVIFDTTGQSSRVLFVVPR